MNTKRIVTISIMTALMCVLSPISIPLAGGVPISLATLVVMLVASLIGYDSLIVVALYIVFGLTGLPVLSGYSSGASIVFGMTGGYIFGYLLLAAAVAYAYKKFDSKVIRFVGMVIGTVLLYVLGTIWFMNFTGMALVPSLMACVIPFIPGDLVKMVAVILLEPRLSKISYIK